MSLIATIWPMIAGACCMLCIVHLMLWERDRRQTSYLLSALMALASGVAALVEMRLMQTSTLPAYAALLRIDNVAVGTMVVAMVWFVQGYLRTGRPRLAIAITGLWGIGLVVNAFAPASLTFARINDLVVRTTFWGEDFHLAVGDPHPAKYLADLASLLFMVYVFDATLRAWRAGARRSAVIVGGSITLFIVAAGIHTPLVDAGVAATPPLIAVAFLAIVVALSYQLADDAARVVRLAHAVRASESRWRTLLDRVQLAVLDVGPDGLVRYANPFFEDLTGRSSASVHGTSVISLIAPDESDEFTRRLRATVDRGPRPHSRWTLMTTIGEPRTLDWSSVQLLTDDGAFDGILSIGADVTDELATRLDLDRTQARLDRVVRAGMLGELVSALSHELNQPLTAILSNAQTARLYLNRERPPLDEVRDILELIIRDEKRANAVIERLRGLMERGDVVLEDLDLAGLIGDVVALVKSRLEHRGVALHIDLDPALPLVVAGRVELQQVILNLLLNAFHELENVGHDRRLITVTAHAESGAVVLAVQDNGPGIAPELISNVFEPFQGDRDGHVGMGLAICRRIVEAYGGTISAENGADGGAVFTVTLPAAGEASRAEHA